MAKTMSKELGPKGIRVLCVAPGRVATKRLEQLDAGRAARDRGDGRGGRTLLGRADPLGALRSPRGVRRRGRFAASERASYLTGTTIMVDGGLTNSTHA